MNILCLGTMTFYYRSIWPVARQLAAEGHAVYIRRQGHFTEQAIRECPTGVSAVDPSALRFICDLTGLDYTYIDAVRWLDPGTDRPLSFGERCKAKFAKNGVSSARHYDVILSVNKCFPQLNEFTASGALLVALPYQNIPDLYLQRGIPFPSVTMNPDADFMFILRNIMQGGHIPSGLPFAEQLTTKARESKASVANKKVLLLHPGGFRGVVSNPDDSEATCLANQADLYKAVLQCLPPGYSLGLKIHPLAAKWHDYPANKPICDQLGITLHDGGWPGNCIFDYDALISLGSSLIFESVGTGVPCFIAGFLGGKREKYYSAIKEYYCNSESELCSAIKNAGAFTYDNPILKEFRYSGNIQAIVREIHRFAHL